MHKKKVYIVEDNYHQLEEIKNYIAGHQSLEIVDFARNGREALEWLGNNNIDLLLLDINLPEYSGIEILENLENPPYVIFITAYDEYAIRAFELGVIDYILKPVNSDRLTAALNRYILFSDSVDRIQKPVKKLGLSFRSHGNNYFISYDDIVYFSANGKSTVIHTHKKDFEASHLMKDFEDRLPENLFIRIHRKYIVNLSCIAYSRVNRESFNLILNDDDDTQIPVSKSYQEGVKKLLHSVKTE